MFHRATDIYEEDKNKQTNQN